MNYKQTTVTGESWVRSSRVLLDHPLDGVSNIKFVEDTILNLPSGEKFITSASSVVMDNFTEENQTESFDLLNPDTDEVIGSSSYLQTYVLLYSLYMHLARKRDNK